MTCTCNITRDDAQLLYKLIICTFFESRCLSTTSGTPSRKNSNTALLPFKENSRDLFFNRLYAAAGQRTGTETCHREVYKALLLRLPLVLVQSRETSFTAKSTSNAAICSRRISRCLIRNNWASTGFCNMTKFTYSIARSPIQCKQTSHELLIISNVVAKKVYLLTLDGITGRLQGPHALWQGLMSNTLEHRLLNRDRRQ